MKTLYFVSILLSAISFAANAQSIEGHLDCKITGSRVETTVGGKYKSYSGLTDGEKVGDSANLTYMVTNESIYIVMKLNNDEKRLIASSNLLDMLGTKRKVERTIDSGIIMTIPDYGYSYSLTPDYIRLKDFSDLTMSRYYKNNWQGMYIKFKPLEMHVTILTFNCQHTNDKFDKAFKIFQ
jgi:hypothetical protein